jgi:hypothetical protein
VFRRAFRRVAAPGTPLGERSLDQMERLLASREGGETTLRGARATVAGGSVLLAAGSGSTADGGPRESAPGSA